VGARSQSPAASLHGRNDGGFNFYFTNEDEKRKWEEVAGTIWDEYIEALKEYYELVGVKRYVLPEKPKWMFDEGIPSLRRTFIAGVFLVIAGATSCCVATIERNSWRPLRRSH
jgi:hypothetical protein